MFCIKALPPTSGAMSECKKEASSFPGLLFDPDQKGEDMFLSNVDKLRLDHTISCPS
jgi:hypothetical protein